MVPFQCELTYLYPYRCSLGTLRALQEPPELSGLWQEQLRRKQLLPDPLGTDSVLSQCGHTLCVPCQLQDSNHSKHCLAVITKKKEIIPLFTSCSVVS